MSTTAPDGRTWLEHSAEWHDLEALRYEGSINFCRITPGWEDQIDHWIQCMEAHEAMATACREAAGTNHTKL